MGDEEQHRLNLRAQRQGQSTIEANYQNTAFNTTNDVTTRYDFDNQQFSYNGSLKSTLATTSTARAFGNSENGESAFLINIEAASDDSSDYVVLVDGSPRGRTQAGRTLLVPVTPYDTYRIEVVSKGESLVNLNENNFVKTVYPGNVISLTWSAKTVKVGYGRILDVDGKPIIDAVIAIAGTIAMTDQNGYFQVEIGEDDDGFEVRKGSDSCRTSFNQDKARDLVVPLGDLNCL